MRIKRRIATAVLVVAAAGLAIAATTASAGSDSSQHAGAAGANKAAAGGVYRVEYESSFDFTGGFDPTGEYLGSAQGILGNLLVRTLIGYKHVAGAPGNVVVPDLATDLGKITNNGKTYTFKLKDGVKFGPPLNRAITSKDILFAFQRIGTPSVVAQYGFYYDVIKGMTAFKTGKSKVIQGIKTPDLKTISFDLTVPTGDFRYRARDARRWSDSAGSRGMLHAAQRVRPLPHLVGPVHVRRLRQAERDELRHHQGLRRHLGLRRHHEDGSRAQPVLQREHGQPGCS